MVKVYLAGKMTQWRGIVRTMIEADEEGLGEGVEIFDPFEKDSNSMLVGDYFHADMEALRAADVVIVYDDMMGGGKGAYYEMGYAAALGKVILYVTDGPMIHGFLVAGTRLAFTSLQSAVYFLRCYVFHHGDVLEAYCDFAYETGGAHE